MHCTWIPQGQVNIATPVGITTNRRGASSETERSQDPWIASVLRSITNLADSILSLSSILCIISTLITYISQ